MHNKSIILETDRLVLRRYCESDLEDLYEYLSDSEVVKFEPYLPMIKEEPEKPKDSEVVKFEPYLPMNRNEVKDNLVWRISTDEMIAVELKANHKMIGNVYLGKREFETMELGYVFNRHYWGKGYAKESCEALIKWAFQNGVHRIYAECNPLNTNSWRLLEALGLSREAYLKQNIYFWKDENNQPIWMDTLIYAILNSK